MIKELWAGIWCLSSLYSVPNCNRTGFDFPQEIHSLWDILGIFDLVGGDGDIATVVHDREIWECIEYNWSCGVAFRIIQVFLRFSLVMIVLWRIYNWNHIIMVSFIAGVIQSIFYADFFWYFIKSNNKERVIKILVWRSISSAVIILAFIFKSFISNLWHINPFLAGFNFQYSLSCRFLECFWLSLVLKLQHLSPYPSIYSKDRSEYLCFYCCIQIICLAMI